MPGALVALLCAGLLARAARGQAEGAAADLAQPPPPPVPAVARTPSGPRPRIHIYDLPDELTKPCHWWGCGRLTEEVRKSKVSRPPPALCAPRRATLALTRPPTARSTSSQTPTTLTSGGFRTWCAAHSAATQPFVRTHFAACFAPQQPFKSQSVTEALFAAVATRWPYWNASVEAKQSRHLITLMCDHGPGDCNFVDQNPLKLGKLPDTWNPASPTRVVSQVQWNSLRDGADAGMDFCSVCFQSGKDVQLATPEGNVCGPLCGYKCVAMHAACFFSLR